MARKLKIAFWVLGGACTLLGLVYGFGGWLHPDANPLGLRDGKFTVPLPAKRPDSGTDQISVRFTPNGNNSPTVISFQNERSRPCLIQRVEYHFTDEFKTPDRERLVGEALTLPVNFDISHYVRPGLFSMTLDEPLQAEGMDWVNLKVAIVHPRLVGKSFKGSVHVFYNNSESIVIDGVEVDVLAREP